MAVGATGVDVFVDVAGTGVGVLVAGIAVSVRVGVPGADVLVDVTRASGFSPAGGVAVAVDWPGRGVLVAVATGVDVAVGDVTDAASAVWLLRRLENPPAAAIAKNTKRAPASLLCGRALRVGRFEARARSL